eukprot:194879-Amphidinium_carterae.1
MSHQFEELRNKPQRDKTEAASGHKHIQTEDDYKSYGLHVPWSLWNYCYNHVWQIARMAATQQ